MCFCKMIVGFGHSDLHHAEHYTTSALGFMLDAHPN
jgi:hypothetical protein